MGDPCAPACQVIEHPTLRYFFHVIDGRDFIDTEGTVLPIPREARAKVIRTAGAFLRDGSDRFWNGNEWQMDVTDANK